MILMIPVDVLCEGCGECPRLTIRSDIARTGDTKVADLSLECAHLTECLDVRSALERHQQLRDDRQKRMETRQKKEGMMG